MQFFFSTVTSCCVKDSLHNCSRIQDVCILFAIIVVFLLFFNTYIFQAGLVSILISKFKATIIFVLVYLGLSVGLHVWQLVSVFLIGQIIELFTPPPVPVQTGRRSNIFYQAVRSSVLPSCLFICYQSCEHDILNTNEPILLKIAHMVHGARERNDLF